MIGPPGIKCMCGWRRKCFFASERFQLSNVNCWVWNVNKLTVSHEGSGKSNLIQRCHYITRAFFSSNGWKHRALEAVIQCAMEYGCCDLRHFTLFSFLPRMNKVDVVCRRWWSVALPLLILLSILPPFPSSIMPLSGCISAEMRFPLIN